MILRLVVMDFAVQLMAAPALAQGKSDTNNAHHYSGGPKTEVPHGAKHPKTTTEPRRRLPTGVIITAADPRRNPITWVRRSSVRNSTRCKPLQESLPPGSAVVAAMRGDPIAPAAY